MFPVLQIIPVKKSRKWRSSQHLVESLVSFVHVCYMRCIKCLSTVGKKRKARSDLAEVCICLAELDKAAEERVEERELKRRKLEWEMEEKRQEAEDRRREAERKHEERMNYMFMMLARDVMGQTQDCFPPTGSADTFPPNLDHYE